MICCAAGVSKAQQNLSYGEAMAKTVMTVWKDSLARVWTYDQGVVYGGLEALWKNTGNADYFNYIQKNIDHYVNDDGTIKTYDKEKYNIDNIKNGNALLMLYNVTGKEKYFKAASLLREQLREQPRTHEGGFWHKKVYPWQMWLDGLYMGEPFYAMYAQRVQDDTAFNDIASQFIFMEKHSRDTKTGLLYHGWDESKEQQWANKETGTSPNFWGRAMGWYGMALVDVLQYFPDDNPHKKELVDILNRFAAAVVKVQDDKTGLWWDVLNFPNRQGNYFEASASCMFVYALAKGTRLGYLPSSYLPAAEKGYKGIIKKFVVKDANGLVHLDGTVSVSGLGGNPYRDGSYAYYLREKVVRDDLKGVGAFIQMCAEMDMIPTMNLGKGKTVLLDGYFNHEKKYDAASNDTIQYHYVWNEDDNNGYSLLGHVFNKYGVATTFSAEKPTAAILSKASMYIIVDPDTPKENPNPNYIQADDIKLISDWVKQGGTLLLLGNDSGNAEFEHFNNLAATFGIHFNEGSYNRVTGAQFEMGAININANNPIFKSTKKIYIKELSTLQLQSPAKAVLTKEDKNIMAVAKYGKGTVFAVGDPWLYNEYTNGRKLPKEFENYKAAEELAKWLIKQ
ncbi:unsaturated rhamnogalacturonyl hydrolase [Parafilimonas terrae]|uniref:Unsaturated rhamnogalacturonyl hydrolase n=2 Tax=Parafilimonas terrae TaxID=1465490 RepID=A0A1I5TQD3_9BACT|nr:unsaturated rhamnogalacturonyl hydrolase [Parafilimonas terrae]